MDDGNRRTQEAGPQGVRLRALTFLAPGIPVELFETVTRYLGWALSCEIELEVESRISGPMHGDSDPFAEGRADIGFLCSPSYVYLRNQERPSIVLVPAAFVFGERAGGQPVYFSDVVVRSDHPAREFADLAGTRWGFNDSCSLSGHFAALKKVAEMGCAGNYFGERVRTGSHLASIEAILAGEIDGAAIDSTVLGRARVERRELEGKLRVLDTWGPFPVQPIVVRKELGEGWAQRIAVALLDLHRTGSAPRLRALGLDRCAPIEDEAYAAQRQTLHDLDVLNIPFPPPTPS